LAGNRDELRRNRLAGVRLGFERPRWFRVWLGRLRSLDGLNRVDVERAEHIVRRGLELLVLRCVEQHPHLPEWLLLAWRWWLRLRFR
jgi:hypothetical protein